MSEALLRAAEALLLLGVPRSAAALLGSTRVRGHVANRLRARAERQSQRPLVPRFYGVGVHGTVGLLLPLDAERGSPRAASDDPGFITSQRSAHAIARARFYDGARLPSLCLALPDALGIEGSSLGLATLLAFVARLSGVEPQTPVVGLGELTIGSDVIGSIGREGPKLEAVARDLAGQDALVLATAEDAAAAPPSLRVVRVETVEDALNAVFGATRFRATVEIMSLDALLRAAHESVDSRQAVRWLRSIRADDLPVADRTELRMTLGIHLRHLGETEEARELHDLARADLDEAAPVVGPEHREYLEMQILATEVDLFDLPPLEARLRALLATPFASLHNRVRCAGMLAQVVSTRGRPAEAVKIREPSLAIQEHHAGMRDELPWTLCALALDAARADDRRAFEGFARRLLTLTPAGDTRQDAFNAAALARGLALLDPPLLIAWIAGTGEWVGAPPDRLVTLARGGAVEGPADLQAARGLARAWRRIGRPEEAAKTGDTAAAALPSHPLARWVGALAIMEGALGAAEVGATAAPALWTTARRTLATAHAPAARYYPVLASMDAAAPQGAAAVSALEAEIDRVWY